MILEKSVEYGVRYPYADGHLIVEQPDKEVAQAVVNDDRAEGARLVSRLVLKGEWGPDA